MDHPRVTFSGSHGVATYPPGATFGPRTMRDYEFVWLTAGEAEYRYGDATVAAPQGSVVLCRPGATDAFVWDRRRRTRHAYVHFDVTATPRDWAPSEAWPLVRVPRDGDILRPMFRHLLTWSDRAGADRGLLTQTLAHMLTTFVTGQFDAADVPRDPLPDPVDRALTLVHRRLEADPAAPVGFADLVDASWVSGAHLCRLFNAALDCTPMTAVRFARLDRAVVLLARSNYSVRQIADLCGFANPFHFSRAFKQAYGRSPRDVRRAVTEGAVPPLPRLLRHWRTG